MTHTATILHEFTGVGPTMTERHSSQSGKRRPKVPIGGIAEVYQRRWESSTLADHHGAIRRSLGAGLVRGTVRTARWWRRSWVGRTLGFGWCISMFTKGSKGSLDPAKVGDDWQHYKAGGKPR
jgi:hypothetical protein